jgi:predicted nucleic acid-binding protein
VIAPRDYLADTNVAARRVLTSDPLYEVVKRAIDTLFLRGDRILITAQCLVEFQALATRPLVANGLGLSPAEANEQAREIEAVFPLLVETPLIYTRWRTLMERHDVRGRQVFDARLVAVMQAHGVTHLLTTNAAHFRHFPGITVVEPHQVSGAS